MRRREFFSTPLLVPLAAVAANEMTITEPLGWEWKHELISMPVSLPAGRKASTAVAVRSDNGEVTAGQIDISGRCWFHANLPASATRTWRVDFQGNAPETDLRVQKESSGIMLSNSLIALRISESAPLAGIRGPDGVWRGSGRFDGTSPSRRSVTVEASGPVLVRVRALYQWTGGGSLDLIAEMRAGEEAVRFEEKSSGVAKSSFVFELGKSFEQGCWTVQSPTIKKMPPPGGGRTAYNFALDFSEESVSKLVPCYAWGLDLATWFAACSKRPDVSDWLGFFAIDAASWEGGVAAALNVETGPGGLNVRLPLGNLQRHWGLLAAKSSEAVNDKEKTNKCWLAQIRLAQTPLERVRKMALNWERPQHSHRPHLLMGTEPLNAAARLRADEPLRKLFEARGKPSRNEEDLAGLYLMTGDATYSKAVKQRVLKSLQSWIKNFMTRGYGMHDNVAIAFSRPLRLAAIDWDMVADAPVVTDEEKKFADRAFAFLLEQIEDPHYYPTGERGFEQGPVNFRSDYNICLTTLACLLTGHPERKRRLQWGMQTLEDEFIRFVFPSGAWEEAPNYQGSTMFYLTGAIRMLKLNGAPEFTQVEAFKATMRFLGDMQTPYDPRRKTAMLPPVGDTTFSFHSQAQQTVFAWAATVYKEDREFAGRMMWHWKQGGALRCGTHDKMMVGRWTAAMLMVDPSIHEIEPLDQATSKRLDGYGARLAHKNAAGEHTYLLIKCGEAQSHYHPDELSFHYYGRGVPLALDYGSMYWPRVNLTRFHNRISIDGKCDEARGGITNFAALPQADYFAGEVIIERVRETGATPDDPSGRAYDKPWTTIRPAAWKRQILLSKNAGYVVVCDTLDSDKPTDWNLHVLAEGVERAGNLWRFKGQLGTDLEVHADGEEVDRIETGDWSYTGQFSKGLIDTWRQYSIDLPVEQGGEKQHWIRWHRKPGSGYRALLLPRKPGDPKVAIQALPGGYRASGEKWTEWTLLSGRATAFSDGNMRMRGAAGMVSLSNNDLSLALHDGDMASYMDVSIEAPGPLQVTMAGGAIRGESSGPVKRVKLTCPLPGSGKPLLNVDGRRHPISSRPVLLKSGPGHSLVFTLPEGAHRFEIQGA